jgi:hypothetical protein
MIHGLTAASPSGGGPEAVPRGSLSSVSDPGELRLAFPFFLFVPWNRGFAVFIGIIHKTDLLFLRCAGNQRARRSEQKKGDDLAF